MRHSSKVKIAIDLTPLRPGGENGGAKTLVLTLLQEFAKRRPGHFEYLLIVESWNYEELSAFHSSNMTCLLQSEIYRSRLTSSPDPTSSSEIIELSSPSISAFKAKFKQKLKEIAKQGLQITLRAAQPILRHKHPFIQNFKAVVKQRISQYPIGAQLLPSFPQNPQDLEPQPLDSCAVLQKYYGVDLLFCPFSSPHLAEDGLPLVAVAYDLQHLDLPFFFTPEEKLHRSQFLRNLVDRADKIICISDFTQQSFKKYLGAENNQLVSIPICIHERLHPHSEDKTTEILAKMGFSKGKYLYFPANFWPHKNHRMLLTAYSIYRHQYLTEALDLVFTGALDEPQAKLQEAVSYLGCDANVHFLGFLSEEELIALWQGCKGLIFPSLYEGFGIPVLEAMWFDRPVACSSVGSLPEVGGDAVAYFDPRKPDDIAKTIAQIAHDDVFVEQLRSRARHHIQQFSQHTMAEQYLDIFDIILATQSSSISTHL